MMTTTQIDDTKILFPNFSKRRKVIERVFSFFLTNLGAERCKSRSPQGFQLKLEMILLAYSLLLNQLNHWNQRL